MLQKSQPDRVRAYRSLLIGLCSRCPTSGASYEDMGNRAHYYIGIRSFNKTCVFSVCISMA